MRGCVADGPIKPPGDVIFNRDIDGIQVGETTPGFGAAISRAGFLADVLQKQRCFVDVRDSARPIWRRKGFFSSLGGSGWSGHFITSPKATAGANSAK